MVRGMSSNSETRQAMSKKPKEIPDPRNARPSTPQAAESETRTDTASPPTIGHVRHDAPPDGSIPLHDLDAEIAVLAAVLLSSAAFARVVEILKPEHFYSEANGRVFGAAMQVAMQGTPLDIVSVASWLRDHEQLAQIGGARYLAQLADVAPVMAHVTAHAQIVHEKWRRRALIAICRRAADKAYGGVSGVQEVINSAEHDLSTLGRTAPNGGAQPVALLLRAAFQQVTAAAERGERSAGISTGFTRLDAKTAGLHPGELMVIASRPGMGKSAFVQNLGVNVASPRTVSSPSPKQADQLIEREEPGYGVINFSLEMPRDQLALRMVCSEARVDIGKFRTGFLVPDDWRRLTESATYISSLPIWVDRGYDVAEIRASALRVQSEYNREATATHPERKLGLVIVDPIQLLESEPRRQNREEETADAVRALKRLAVELDIAVIAISELSRAVETRGTRDKRPHLWDIRDSGAIEDAADTVIFIYRDEYYNPETTNSKGLAEIIVSKQRNGPIGKVMTKFTAAYARFDNLAPGDCPDNFDDE